MNNFISKLIINQFDVNVGIAADCIFDISKVKLVKTISSTKNPFAIHPKVIIADSFLFVKDKLLYLFYEEQEDLIGKGILKMINTKDLLHWSKSVTVLEKPYHLSYPNVFELEGQIYMMPEAGQNNTIDLYIPDNNLLSHWTYKHTLLSGFNFVDSCIVKQNDLFYLFTTVYSENLIKMLLFYSASLDSQWYAHPQNPITVEKNKARCAGSVVKWNNKLYRPAQRNERYYGSGVDIYQITKLSSEEYEEVLYIEKLLPYSLYPYKYGGHQFSVAYFNGKSIIATDSVHTRVNLYEVLRRIKNKILK